jgi:hypothetical protein
LFYPTNVTGDQSADEARRQKSLPYKTRQDGGRKPHCQTEIIS